MSTVTDNETYNEASDPTGSDGHMNESDSFNGYANRETWAFNLHWQNDQGLYNETLEEARRIVSEELQAEEFTKISDYAVGELIVNYWRDYIDSARREFTDGTALDQTLDAFEREVGSWWRIDYCEVGEAVRESLDAES